VKEKIRQIASVGFFISKNCTLLLQNGARAFMDSHLYLVYHISTPNFEQLEAL